MHSIRAVNNVFTVGVLLLASSRALAQEVGKLITLTSPAVLRISRLQEDGSFNADEFKIYRNTHGQLVTSVRVLKSALRRPEIAKLSLVEQWGENAVRELGKSTRVESPGDAELMTIVVSPNGASDTDREQLAKLTNAVVDAFTEEIVNGERLEAVAERDALAQTVQKFKEHLRKRRTMLNKLDKDYGDSSRRIHAEQIAALSQQMMNHAMELAALNRRAAPNDSSKERQKIEQQIAELREVTAKQVAALQKIDRYTPEIAELQAEIQQDEDFVRRYSRKLGEEDIAVIRPSRIRLIEKAEP